jgi:hypothetical protein
MSFELQPTLTGDLVHLRPLRPDDWDALLAAASDPLIWAQHPESDRYTPDVFRRYFDAGIASGGTSVVIDRRTSGIVGSTRSPITTRPRARSRSAGRFSSASTGAAPTTAR